MLINLNFNVFSEIRDKEAVGAVVDPISHVNTSSSDYEEAPELLGENTKRKRIDGNFILTILE